MNLALTAASGLRLRTATLADAEMLLQWRNDPLTRQESLTSSEIKLEQHLSWLITVLESDDRLLLVAEIDGQAVGTVRADFRTGRHSAELSWTVAPSARGRGLGKEMVRLLADYLASYRLYARVKTGNQASHAIAAHAGLAILQESQGVTEYERPPLR